MLKRLKTYHSTGRGSAMGDAVIVATSRAVRIRVANMLSAVLSLDVKCFVL